MIYITLNDELGDALGYFPLMSNNPNDNVVVTRTDEGIYIETDSGDFPDFMVPEIGNYFLEINLALETVATSKIILGPETVFRFVDEEEDPLTLTGYTFSMEEPLPERGSFTGYCAQMSEEMSMTDAGGMWLFGTGATSNEVEVIPFGSEFQWSRIGEIPYVPETVGVIDITDYASDHQLKKDVWDGWGNGFYSIEHGNIYFKILFEYTGEKRNVKPYNGAASTVPGDVVRFKILSREDNEEEIQWETGITIDNQNYVHGKTLSSLVAEGQAVDVQCQNVFYMTETTIPLYADTVPGVTHHTKKDIVAYNPVPFPGSKKLELDTEGVQLDHTKTFTWEELSFTQENYNACKSMFNKNVPSVMWGITLNGETPAWIELGKSIDGINLVFPNGNAEFYVSLDPTNRTIEVSLYVEPS